MLFVSMCRSVSYSGTWGLVFFANLDSIKTFSSRAEKRSKKIEETIVRNWFDDLLYAVSRFNSTETLPCHEYAVFGLLLALFSEEYRPSTASVQNKSSHGLKRDARPKANLNDHLCFFRWSLGTTPSVWPDELEEGCTHDVAGMGNFVTVAMWMFSHS